MKKEIWKNKKKVKQNKTNLEKTIVPISAAHSMIGIMGGGISVAPSKKIGTRNLVQKKVRN